MNALVEGQARTYSSDEQLQSLCQALEAQLRGHQDRADGYAARAPPPSCRSPGLDRINEIALENKKIKKLLTKEQLHELVHPMGNKPI